MFYGEIYEKLNAARVTETIDNIRSIEKKNFAELVK